MENLPQKVADALTWSTETCLRYNVNCAVGQSQKVNSMAHFMIVEYVNASEWMNELFQNEYMHEP